ncbi:hypothetical protein GBN32_01330 [Plesiomonas shigelloides]|uniref:hypothetical protein n=1 Tax=Plesiomonas shigelloides TaxID=703 RepID=UPI0012621048|nr:hypothetical protein [Plesiomonas shigelloides]KAB7715145.1 hypothetical protein GBN32_01330 [Plesiomonas shigelloides]
MSNMEYDVFADYPFGKAALKKMKSKSDNFRLFFSENMLDGSMKVKGAEFRVAKKGKNKGKLSIMVPNTTQTVFITADEIRAHRIE